jgi:catechol 2,3-dioxygenase-like lactoylglutathione lyase family enzyme
MRVDHMLLAVRDLTAATDGFRQGLGLDARVGGSHPGRGTHNSLVQLGTAYLELIGVDDASLPRGQELAHFLADGDGPLSFALAVDDLAAASQTLTARGLRVDPPRDGSRRTPSGVLLRWRSANIRPGPGGPVADAPELPFLIEWKLDDAGRDWFRDRLAASHLIPWGTAHALLIATPDPDSLAAEYERLFGWARLPHERFATLRMPGGDEVNPRLGPAPYVILVAPSPNDASVLQRVVGDAARARIDRAGSGVLGLAIQVHSVDQTVAALVARGRRVQVQAEGRWAVVEPRDAHGLLIEIVQ